MGGAPTRYLVNVGFWNLVGGEPAGDACLVEVGIEAASDAAARAAAIPVAERLAEAEYGKCSRKVQVMRSVDVTGVPAKPWREKAEGTTARISWSQMAGKG